MNIWPFRLAFAYDAAGNIVSITPPGKPALSLTFAENELIGTHTAPNAGSGAAVTSFTYNAHNALIQVTRPRNETIEYGYDSGGRVTSREVAAGTTIFAYHPTNGALTTLTQQNGNAVALFFAGQETNLYAYAANNPLNVFDPEGRDIDSVGFYQAAIIPGHSTISVNGSPFQGFYPDNGGAITFEGSKLKRNPDYRLRFKVPPEQAKRIKKYIEDQKKKGRAYDLFPIAARTLSVMPRMLAGSSTNVAALDTHQASSSQSSCSAAGTLRSRRTPVGLSRFSPAHARI